MSERTHYIVLGPFCWGRAKTDHEAYANCVSNISGYATGEVKFICFYVTEDARVNDMGGINFTPTDDNKNVGDPGRPLKVWERTVHRRLIDEYNSAMDLISYGDDKYEVETKYYDEDGNPE